MNKRSYMEGTYFYGRLFGLILFGLIVAFPFIFCFIFNCVPQWEALGKGLLAVAPLYCIVGAIEMFTYIPMLGAGGSYMAFVTGNCSNLKLPCALDALKKAGVSATSEEGECISTIAIAVSNIVTTFIIIIGVLLIVPLQGVIDNPALDPAFDNIIPALFGALGVAFFSKNLKLSIPSIILMVLLFVFIPALNGSTVSVMVPVGVVFTVLVGWVMYKKKIIK